MPTQDEINQFYLEQHNQLETSFFDIIDPGLPSQHRVLKDSLSLDDFNAEHSLIWRNWRQALINNGFLTPEPEPEPPIVFEPENPALGVEHRLTHVEQFLQTLYPE